jgi:hypothetical protein
MTIKDKIKLDAMMEKILELQGYVNTLQDAVTIGMKQLAATKVSRFTVFFAPHRARYISIGVFASVSESCSDISSNNHTRSPSQF